MHVPKTAGSTFLSIVRRYYESGQVLDHSVVYLYCQAHQLPRSTRVPLETGFQWLSSDQKKHIECICAHMKYGMHKYITDSPRYVTFLREPVARAISNYYHIMRDKEHRFHDATRGFSLEQFFESDAAFRLSNIHTRMISGAERHDPDMLAIAKHRLVNDFSFFGISEYFDESLVCFSESEVGRSLDWPLLYYTRHNVATNYNRQSEIPSRRVIELIREQNQLDLQLYEFARDLFEKRTTGVVNFRAKVHRFRFMNELYGRMQRFLSGKQVDGEGLAQSVERLLVSYMMGQTTGIAAARVAEHLLSSHLRQRQRKPAAP